MKTNLRTMHTWNSEYLTSDGDDPPTHTEQPRADNSRDYSKSVGIPAIFNPISGNSGQLVFIFTMLFIPLIWDSSVSSHAFFGTEDHQTELIASNTGHVPCRGRLEALSDI